MFAYVGCYTTPDRGGRGEGIAVYRVDGRSGAWAHVQTLAGVANPSFLAVEPGGRFLYCVHGGNAYHAASALAIDPHTGTLTLLNTQASGGPNPVHLAVHPGGRWLAVANYASGTAAVLPINPGGTLGPLAGIAHQTGEPGPHPTEQTAPHPHHIPFDPRGNYLLVPDKGLDRTFVYRFDAKRGTLAPGEMPAAASAPGAGPRHAAFHPHLPCVYVINELDSTLSVFAYDAGRGRLAARQVVSTLPPDFGGTSTTAELALTPSGRFLYGSNRGHDSIAIFAVDPTEGTLTATGWQPCGGRTPRFFALDPAGAFLYCANQQSDTIVPFRVHPDTGALMPSGAVIRTGSPVCIVFAGQE